MITIEIKNSGVVQDFIYVNEVVGTGEHKVDMSIDERLYLVNDKYYIKHVYSDGFKELARKAIRTLTIGNSVGG